MKTQWNKTYYIPLPLVLHALLAYILLLTVEMFPLQKNVYSIKQGLYYTYIYRINKPNTFELWNIIILLPHYLFWPFYKIDDKITINYNR